MIKKQKRSFIEGYISENRLRIVINICFVIAGVICGCCLFLYAGGNGVMAQKLAQTVSEIETAQAKDIFISALKDAGVVCAVFYICSLFYMGEFLCPAYVLLRCAAYGFSCCIIINTYPGAEAVLMLVSLVPQMIFYICALVVFSVETAKQSRFMSGCGDKSLRARTFVAYLSITILPLMLLFLGCLVEGFATPYFILWCLKNF